MNIILNTIEQSFLITLLVFVMMIGVDYFNVVSRGKLALLVAKSRGRQYMVSSFIGVTPGCVGAFMNVSFYTHGLISFGALVAGMLAANGDEGFVMLALFPKMAIVLMGILFLLGLGAGVLVDRLDKIFKFKSDRACLLSEIHKTEGPIFSGFNSIVEEFKEASFLRFNLGVGCLIALVGIGSGTIGPEEWDMERITVFVLTIAALFIFLTVPYHYLREHIWNHIGRRHLWKVAIWTFAALLMVRVGLKYWHLDELARNHLAWTLVMACLVGLIPQSGPHLIFVVLYSQGQIPFSVLMANAIVQDGHGLLPLLSYSVRESVILKAINLIVGLCVGGTLFALGF